MQRTHKEELITKNQSRCGQTLLKRVILSLFNLPWIAKVGIGKDFLLLAWQAVAGVITLQPIKGGWRLCRWN